MLGRKAWGLRICVLPYLKLGRKYPIIKNEGRNVAKKVIVEIKIATGHQNTLKLRTKRLLEQFMGIALSDILEAATEDILVKATLGVPIAGRRVFQQLAGIRLAPKQVMTGAVEVRVQPRSNDSRRVFYVIPPLGMKIPELFNRMKKAENEIRQPLPPTASQG